jgi:hypothetical protein
LAYFVYLSCYEKVNIPSRNFTDMAEQHAGTLHSDNFFDFRVFSFSKNTFYRRKKKDMYICFNQVL